MAEELKKTLLTDEEQIQISGGQIQFYGDFEKGYYCVSTLNPDVKYKTLGSVNEARRFANITCMGMDDETKIAKLIENGYISSTPM